jgi:hypothetical protein
LHFREGRDRSIYRAIGEILRFPARACTREERREDGTYFRSASLDETKIMAQAIGSDHAWSLSEDFYYFFIYTPRSDEFHERLCPLLGNDASFFPGQSVYYPFDIVS